jgi:hypothetical protein
MVDDAGNMCDRRSSSGVVGVNRPRSGRLRKATHTNKISSALGIVRVTRRIGALRTGSHRTNDVGRCFDERRSVRPFGLPRREANNGNALEPSRKWKSPRGTALVGLIGGW